MNSATAAAPTARPAATSAEDMLRPPYPPSWVDRLTAAIARRPGAGWPVYLGLWLVLAAAETAVKWTDGAYPPGTFFPFHLVFAGIGLYALGLMRYLDGVAARAIAAFRPALTGDDAEYAVLRYEITTLPARPARLAGMAG